MSLNTFTSYQIAIVLLCDFHIYKAYQQKFMKSKFNTSITNKVFFPQKMVMEYLLIICTSTVCHLKSLFFFSFFFNSIQVFKITVIDIMQFLYFGNSSSEDKSIILVSESSWFKPHWALPGSGFCPLFWPLSSEWLRVG